MNHKNNNKNKINVNTIVIITILIIAIGVIGFSYFNTIIQYKKEILAFPHARSIEAINNRAKFWGSIVNLEYAEAFVKIREIQSI